MKMLNVLDDRDSLRKKKFIVNQMYNERSSYESVWTQLSKYINPYRGKFDESKETGERKDMFLLDPMPQEAHAKCAAGLHSGLTSPSRPWFELAIDDDEMQDSHEVKQWLNECKDMMMAIYAKSNIYNALQQIEAELSLFGTAACLLREDYESAIWARPFTCGEYAGAVDARGKVCKFATKSVMPAYQVVKEFGYENCSNAVQTAYDNKNLQTTFEIWMLIEENDEYDEEELSMGNFPWRSYFFESGGEKFLRVSGYYEQPFLMPRWTVIANQTYGVGPGHSALGNCMQLQKLEKINMRLLENVANPPLVGPSIMGKLNRNPGAYNLVPDGSQAGIAPLFGNNGIGSRQDVYQSIQAKQSQIQSAFFNDLFIMLSAQDNPQMTAREVAERHEEKLLMLSPVLEQMHNEVLAPLTKRCFGILLRHKVLPPAPQGVDVTRIKVDFVSLLAQAQKMADVPAIEKTMAFMGNLAGINPEIVDNIDFDKALREFGSKNGAPELIFKAEEEVQELRQQRAEQQAQQQQAEQMAQMAKPVKDSVEAAKLLADTPNTAGASLYDIFGGM